MSTLRVRIMRSDYYVVTPNGACDARIRTREAMDRTPGRGPDYIRREKCKINAGVYNFITIQRANALGPTGLEGSRTFIRQHYIF